MSPIDQAAALRVQQQSDEMASLVVEAIFAEAARAGRAIEPADFLSGAEALLAAAWRTAEMGCEERIAARKIFAGFLRRFADNIERMENE